jgi:membrane peptidoglycan carboxypeptidase
MARARGLTVFGLANRAALFVGVSALSGVLVAGLMLPLVGSFGVAARTATQSFDDLPSVLRTPVLPQQTRILTSDGKLLATIYSENRVVVPLKQISPLLQQAVVAIEDSRFYEHKGVDVQGLGRALVSDLTGGTVQGGSTLTQQYVKNVLALTATTSADRAAATARTFSRKIREMRLALGLEAVWSKQQILEGYLNIAYFGHGAYGAQAASLQYFGVPASKLTLPQAATLAGIVQSPVSYDPLRNPRLSTKRRNVVLKRMYDLGLITAKQKNDSEATPMTKLLHPQSPPNGCSTSVAPFFCQYVIKTVKTDPIFGATQTSRDAFLAQGGLTITTTLNTAGQAAAQAAVDGAVHPTDPSQRGAAISVVQPGTGNILAMAQNRTWGTKGAGATTLNYNAPKAYNGVGMQAGSTFKVFVLAAAIEQGIPINAPTFAPARVPTTGYTNCAGHSIDDKNKTVGNSEGDAVQAYNMQTATWASVNTYFMLLEQQTGVCRPWQIAQSFGVTRADGKALLQVPTFTLGTNDITPLTMASVYATLAAHGKACPPRAILKITDGAGKAVQVPSAACTQAIAPAVADGVTSILTGVIDNPMGTGYSIKIGRPAAGKTGTTNGNVQVWFDGYTPQLAAAAWVGDPTGSDNADRWAMRDIVINGTFVSRGYGYLLAGPIWRSTMSAFMANQPVQLFAGVDTSVVKGYTEPVPPLVGHGVADALGQLNALGLGNQVVNVPSLLPVGIVVSQTPAAGSTVSPGTVVVLSVSSGPAPPSPPAPTATATATGKPSATPSPTKKP